MQPSRYGNPRTCCRVCLSNSFAVPNFHGWLSVYRRATIPFCAFALHAGMQLRWHLAEHRMLHAAATSCCLVLEAVFMAISATWRLAVASDKSPIWPRAHVRTSHKFVLESYLHHVRSLLSILPGHGSGQVLFTSQFTLPALPPQGAIIKKCSIDIDIIRTWASPK